MAGLAMSSGVRCDSIPTITFDSGGYRVSEKLDAINDFIRNLYRYSPLNADDGADRRPRSAELTLQAWKLGCIAAAKFTHSPVVADSSGNVDPEFRGDVILRILRSGQMRIRSTGFETRMVPGQVYLFQAENTIYSREPGSSILLRIPGEAVGYDPSRHGSVLCFDGHDWGARVVCSALEDLFRSLPTMTLAEAQLAGPMICDLVRHLLHSARLGEAEHEVWRTARAQAMRSYVLDNLKNPDVGTSHLQVQFNTSRATVYRAFEGEGGVSNFVRKERLKAIDRDLRLMTPRYGRVRQIAETYGFTDQSAFTKAFKRLYGVRPSEVIGANRSVGNARRETGKRRLDELPNLASFWTDPVGVTGC